MPWWRSQTSQKREQENPMGLTEDELEQLHEPGDEVWIERSSRVRMTPYGVRYHDFVLVRMGEDRKLYEADRKHYDPEDEDFIKPS
jgi:hypothetical protein